MLRSAGEMRCACVWGVGIGTVMGNRDDKSAMSVDDSDILARAITGQHRDAQTLDLRGGSKKVYCSQ